MAKPRTLQLVRPPRGADHASRGTADDHVATDTATEAGDSEPPPHPDDGRPDLRHRDDAEHGLSSGRDAAGPVSARPVSRQAWNELEDASLVALASDGDSRAAEQLYRRHAGFAFNLAARIAGSTTDVEDVVHDAFLRAFDGLGSLRNPKAFKGWLGSIVVHAMRSRLRRSKWLRFFGLGQSGDVVDIGCIASDEASPRVRAELAQVYALLRTMNADDRIAWTLRFVDGHDLKTAAELADCSLATIKRRIRRAQSYVETHFVSGFVDDDESSDGADDRGDQGAHVSNRAANRSSSAGRQPGEEAAS